MDPNSDILTVRKAIAKTISNESFRIQQQYRHEMAKKRREELETQRIMNRKIKEMKDKEKEIALRYRQRNAYGQLLGTKKKLKPKEKTKVEGSITVLLPIINNKENMKSTDEVQYESHSIPKKMLPNGKEDISAYKVVKKTNDLYRKYGANRQGVEHDGGSIGMDNNKSFGQNNDRMDLDNFHTKDPVYQIQRKSREEHVQHNYKQNYSMNQCHVYANYRQGPSYEEILNYYKTGGGLRRDDLAIFGKARNANQYELLIVDEGPRTEEIKVKQRAIANPRAFDILTIKENHRGTTPCDDVII